MSYFASIQTAGTIVARVIVPNIQIENSCECVCVCVCTEMRVVAVSTRELSHADPYQAFGELPHALLKYGAQEAVVGVVRLDYHV